MGASEQPPLPQQTQNQTKVRGYMHKQPHICMFTWWAVFRERSVWSKLKVIPRARFPLQPVPTIGRSSLSLIQLTSSSPGQRPMNHAPMGMNQQNNMTGNRGPRPLDQVTCYKVSHLNISVLTFQCVFRICFETLAVAVWPFLLRVGWQDQYQWYMLKPLPELFPHKTKRKWNQNQINEDLNDEVK